MHRRWLGVLLVAACVACRQADVYPPDVVENFMSACSARGDARVCRCALDALERRFALEEFRAFEARVRAGEVPKEMMDAVYACR